MNLPKSTIDHKYEALIHSLLASPHMRRGQINWGEKLFFQTGPCIFHSLNLHRFGCGRLRTNIRLLMQPFSYITISIILLKQERPNFKWKFDLRSEWICISLWKDLYINWFQWWRLILLGFPPTITNGYQHLILQHF